MNVTRTTHSWRTRLMRRRPAFQAALVVYIIVILVAAPTAQQLTGFAPAAAAPASSPIREVADGSEIDLLVGRSAIVNVGATIARVSLTVPDVADAMVTGPTQLLVHGKQPGTISLFVWDKGGSIKTYEVRVRRDLSALSAHLKQLFPGESITVLGSGKDVVVSGTVTSQYVIDKAADVAAGYVEKKENVVNLMKQQEGVASSQVMLRVRFAEVSRSAVQQLGASLFTGPGGFHDYIARSTTQQFTAPNYDEMVRSSIQGPDKWGGGRDTVDSTGGKYSLSDFLNLFVFNNRYNVGAVVKALSEKGLFQSLAEPNLIAINGKEASFLAGGEFPYPVVQGGGNTAAVTIQFKEFGVRLNFTPTILGGDLINLKVRPEVSSLDFANGVTVEGFRVPALATRRTETEVELRDGQTFAIAGLMNNTLTDTMRKIPGIGDIPILGWLFKSKGVQKNQTELVVMITPTIIRKGQMGVSEGLPSLVEPYMTPPAKTYPNPDAYVGSPRYEPNQAQPSDAVPTAAPAPAPAQTPATKPQGAPETMPARPISAPASLPSAKPAATTPVTTPAAPQGGSSALPVPPIAPIGAGVTPPLASPNAVPPPPPMPPMAAQAAMSKPQQPQPALSREDEKAREQALAEQKKAEAIAERKRLEAEKREAEEQKAAERREAEQKKQAEKAAREQARRDAEVQKKNEEVARKKAADEQKRQKNLADAAARLKAAQTAYQAEVEKGRATGEKKPSGSQQ